MKRTPWFSISLILLSLLPTVYAEEQSFEKNVTTTTTVTDGTAMRTRVWEKRLGNSESAHGVSVETLTVDDTSKHYSRDGQRVTLNGSALTESVSHETVVDGGNASRNYDRTVTNQTTGQSVARSSD